MQAALARLRAPFASFDAVAALTISPWIVDCLNVYRLVAAASGAVDEPVLALVCIHSYVQRHNRVRARLSQPAQKQKILVE